MYLPKEARAPYCVLRYASTLCPPPIPFLTLTHSSHITRAFNIETAIIKDIAKQVSVARTHARRQGRLTLSLCRCRLD
jgi:hypothetical protein